MTTSPTPNLDEPQPTTQALLAHIPDHDLDLLVATEMSPLAFYAVLHWGIDVPDDLLTGLNVHVDGLTTRFEAMQASEAKARIKTEKAAETTDTGLSSDSAEARLNILLAKFRSATATPEQRYVLAERYGLAYEDLTNWAIRADLLQLPGLSRATAARLAFVGVLGVHDLLMRGPQPIWGRPVGQADKDLGTALDAVDNDPEWPRLSFHSTKGEAAGAKDLPAILQAAQAHVAKHPAELIGGTEVVVVVKGAGGQTQDATLSEFIRGFWVAVNQADPRSTMAIEPQAGLTGDIATFQTGNQRLWVKEAYWEPALKDASALQAFLLEWQTATYAYASMLNPLVGMPQPDPRSGKRELPGKYKIGRSFRSMLLLYLWMMLFVVFVLFFGRVARRPDVDLPFLEPGQERGLVGLLDRIPLITKLPTDSGKVFASLCVLLVFFAIARAVWATYILREKKTKMVKGEPLPRLNSEVALTYVIALVALILSPVWYFIGLTLLIMVELILLIARDVFWKCREDFDNDYLPPPYRPYDAPEPVTLKQWWKDIVVAPLRSYMLSPVLYRFTVVMVLPVVSIMLVLTRVLRFIPNSIPVVGGWAANVEKFIGSMVSGSMGDVSIYAGDPPTASRVQAIVQSDIRWFHERHDVAHIHVFAHSQGTPITYETLFRHLPDRYCKKIRTYVTIGSVLNYYHQSNPVLDALYYERFPVATEALRQREQSFDPRFRWINCWNRNDPITEFFGLTDYHQVAPWPKGKRPDPGDEDAEQAFRSRPVNVLTPGSWFPASSHSEYWQNLAEVQGPMVARVRGLPDEPAWRFDEHWATTNRSHMRYRESGNVHNATLVLWLAGVALLAIIAFGLFPLAADRLWSHLPASIRTVPGALLPLGWQTSRLMISRDMVYLGLLVALLVPMARWRPQIAGWLERRLVVTPARRATVGPKA